MQKVNQKTHTSTEERKQDLRNTTISMINHKLQKMNIDQLREVLQAAYATYAKSQKIN